MLELSEEAFWGLTLAQFNALAEQHAEVERRKDYRAALICSVIAEVNRDRKRRIKAYSPSDFMPQEKEKPMTDKGMSGALRHINTMLGGEER